VIRVKNLFDQVEPDDGVRLFVEPTGLTLDLVEWCAVHHVLNNIAPPKRMLRSLEGGPDRYPEFRGQYHDWLSGSKFGPALDELATLDTKAMGPGIAPFVVDRNRDAVLCPLPDAMAPPHGSAPIRCRSRMRLSRKSGCRPAGLRPSCDGTAFHRV